MNARRISWEIIVAGLAFTGISLYLLSRDMPVYSTHSGVAPHYILTPPTSPPEPPLPADIVIDIEGLQKLEELNIKLNNLDSILVTKSGAKVQKAVEQAIRKVERELRQIDKTRFR